MKKISPFLMAAILATTLLGAALPGKMVRLEVYNWTGEPVYIQLKGETSGGFYYLTVPPTARVTGYAPKAFTVLADVYERTTWACGGVESSGELRIFANQRLTFTACDRLPMRRTPYDWDLNGQRDKYPNFGEQSMEKVVFFEILSDRIWFKISIPPFSGPNRSASNLNIWVRTPFAVGSSWMAFEHPFALEEFCAPNCCFYRVIFNPGVGSLYVSYGPGLNNLFRYRY
jgi:hypothetical protein